MSTTVLAIFISITIVSFSSLVGVAVLSLGERLLRKILWILVSFSTGALLGNAVLHLLPEVAHNAEGIWTGFPMVLGGILFSFVIEQFIHWRHCHSLTCEEHVHPVGYLILIGDGVHNVLDGMHIASSFVVDMRLGIATTMAVLLHEIPQELGDFAVLLHSGFSRMRALMLNLLSALTAFLGAGAALFLVQYIAHVESTLVAVAAGHFLYIAGVDLIPELHKETRVRWSLLQLVAMLAGIAIMFAMTLGHSHTVPESADLHGEEMHDH